MPWDAKDPNEVLDYDLDWYARLDGDTISTSTWTVPGGITKNSDSHGTTATKIWLSSGTTGSSYDITNRIVTAGGRTMDHTETLMVEDK
jgi:hypothetical protein